MRATKRGMAGHFADTASLTPLVYVLWGCRTCVQI